MDARKLPQTMLVRRETRFIRVVPFRGTSLCNLNLPCVTLVLSYRSCPAVTGEKGGAAALGRREARKQDYGVPYSGWMRR